MVIIGGLLIPAGIALIAVGGNHDCKNSSYSSSGTGPGYYSGKDGSLALCALGAAEIVLDVAMIGGGILMMVVGKNKMSESENSQGLQMPAWFPTRVGATHQSIQLGWSF
jgi:hypothetical protein